MPVDTQQKLLPSIWQQTIICGGISNQDKSDFHLGLDKFVKEYGAPEKMTYDGAQEQIGRKTEFQ